LKVNTLTVVIQSPGTGYSGTYGMMNQLGCQHCT